MKKKVLSSLSILDLLGIIFLTAGAGILIRTACFAVSGDIWFDELFTVELASRPVGELISLAARDVHPPLYYIIVKLVYIILTPFGIDAVTAAKLSSVIPYLLFGVYAVAFVRKRYGWFGTGLTIFMVETMPQMSQYIIEARMYSWCAFCVAAMYIHTETVLNTVNIIWNPDHKPVDITGNVSNREVDITQNATTHVVDITKKYRRIYINMTAVLLYGTAAMYLHYYSAIAAVMTVIYMITGLALAHRRNRGNRGLHNSNNHISVTETGSHTRIFVLSGICILAAAASYLPWVGNMLAQAGAVRSAYWIQPLTWRVFPGCLKFIFLPDFTSNVINLIFASVLMAGYAIMFTAYIAKRFGYLEDAHDREPGTREGTPAGLSIPGTLIIPVCTAMTGIIASFLVRPVFVYRYLIPVMFLFWMGYACLISDTIGGIVFVKESSDEEVSIPVPYRTYRWIYGVTIIVSFVTLLTGMRCFDMFRGSEQIKYDGMDRTTDILNAVSEIYPDEKIICNFNQIQALMWYYQDCDSILWGETDETLIADICGRSPMIMTTDAEELERIIRSDGAGSFLFFGSFNARDEIIDEWGSAGFKSSLIFDSVFLERYYFNIYHIRL